MLRRLGMIVSCVGIVAGCDPEPPAATEKMAEAPGRRPADGGMDVPPTGNYEVTVKVVSDDCTPRYAPPPAWQVFVDAKAGAGRAQVNVPLSALPPTTQTRTAARSVFVVMPAAPLTHRNDAIACGPASRTFEVIRASREGFTLAISTVYGERASCEKEQPAKCTTKIEQVYRLTELVCAAQCQYDAGKPDCQCS